MVDALHFISGVRAKAVVGVLRTYIETTPKLDGFRHITSGMGLAYCVIVTVVLVLSCRLKCGGNWLGHSLSPEPIPFGSENSNRFGKHLYLRKCSSHGG
jgi:hypothetical protein